MVRKWQNTVVSLRYFSHWMCINYTFVFIAILVAKYFMFINVFSTLQPKGYLFLVLDKGSTFKRNVAWLLIKKTTSWACYHFRHREQKEYGALCLPSSDLGRRWWWWLGPECDITPLIRPLEAGQREEEGVLRFTLPGPPPEARVASVKTQPLFFFKFSFPSK